VNFGEPPLPLIIFISSFSSITSPKQITIKLSDITLAKALAMSILFSLSALDYFSISIFQWLT